MTKRLFGIAILWLTGFLVGVPIVAGETVAGRFAVVSMDGSLGEWQGGDVFYNDSDIAFPGHK